MFAKSLINEMLAPSLPSGLVLLSGYPLHTNLTPASMHVASSFSHQNCMRADTRRWRHVTCIRPFSNNSANPGDAGGVSSGTKRRAPKRGPELVFLFRRESNLFVMLLSRSGTRDALGISRPDVNKLACANRRRAQRHSDVKLRIHLHE